MERPILLLCFNLLPSRSEHGNGNDAKKRSIFNFYFLFYFLMLYYIVHNYNLHNYVYKHHKCWWKQQYKGCKSLKEQVKTGPWTYASYSKNGEKAMQCRFTLGKQQVCTYYHTFSYILSLSLYNYMYHTKLPKLFHVLHFCVCMNDTRQKFSFCFSELRYMYMYSPWDFN